MKKIFWGALGVLLLSTGIALSANWTVPRLTTGSDQQILTSNATLVDGYIYWAGVTVGDSLVLRNGGIAGDAAIYFSAPTANGYMPLQIINPITMDKGIYFDSNVTTGAFGAGLIYQEGR